MLSLIIDACMTEHPEKCQPFKVNMYVEDRITPHQCVMQALPDLAKWAGDNPAWSIKAWKCKDVQQDANGVYGDKEI